MIVVDSGSTRRHAANRARGAGAADRDPGASRSRFGGALNTGCAAAVAATLLVALSAHAFPRDPGWLGRMIDRDRPTSASPARAAPTTTPTATRCARRCARTPRRPAATRLGLLERRRRLSAELWRRRRFREDMPATEDKEWALLLARPRLPGAARSRAPRRPRPQHDRSPTHYRRARIEQIGFSMFLQSTSRSGPRRTGARLVAGQRGLRQPLAGAVQPPAVCPVVGRRAADRADRARPPRASRGWRSHRPLPGALGDLRRQRGRRAAPPGARGAGRGDEPPRGPRPRRRAPGRATSTRTPAARSSAGLRGLLPAQPGRGRSRPRLAAALAARGAGAAAARARAGARAPAPRPASPTCTSTSPPARRSTRCALASLLRIPYSLTAHAYDIFESPANLARRSRGRRSSPPAASTTGVHLRSLVEPRGRRADPRRS